RADTQVAVPSYERLSCRRQHGKSFCTCRSTGGDKSADRPATARRAITGLSCYPPPTDVFHGERPAALLLLTALNFLNYIDRNVLFAVQPLIQKEFALSDQQVGFLTSAFFICYMIAAPLIVPLADRFPRKRIMALGAFVWSLATLLSAVTHNYDELLLRHVIVGIGEATFVAISPAFLADLFPETIRGRVMGFFYMATPVGSALGYIVGGYLGHHYGDR